MKLTGIHHLTAVTADATRNHAFYTQALGMRLVKKTVNQDDVSAYHLFYADGQASPGTRHHLLRLAGGARAPRHAQHRRDRPARGRREGLRLVEASASTPLGSQHGRSPSATAGSSSTSRISRASA